MFGNFLLKTLLMIKYVDFYSDLTPNQFSPLCSLTHASLYTV